jgi:cardiolipin synthase
LVNLPNFFTLVRLFLTPFIGRAILTSDYRNALVLCLIAGASDALDGYLARRLHEVTAAGAYLDPIADKILLSVVYISLGISRAMPWWMVVVVFARDVLILGMAAYALLFTSIRSFPPSIWGKMSTLLQIVAALAVIAAHGVSGLPVALALWLMIAGTIVSGFHYAWRGVSILSSKSN